MALSGIEIAAIVVGSIVGCLSLGRHTNGRGIYVPPNQDEYKANVAALQENEAAPTAAPTAAHTANDNIIILDNSFS